ncbi:glycosyltransferase [Pacificispira sp.]|uniref:glycosyltransferase n=1 Tax=Pacificispira sp. TaxID=2888761 RepID=UPI003BAD7C23
MVGIPDPDHPPPGNTPRFDAAIVIPTVLRETLPQAVRSVFGQRGVGRIQVLIGVDCPADAPRGMLDTLKQECPDNVQITVVDPGYSTSNRSGGMHAALDCGALRTVMSYLAHSRYVAYLDDDNWLHESHLFHLREAIAGKDWAYCYRWYVDPETDLPACLDRWESVGPGRGVYAKVLDGFVDPNCLMIDKVACEPVLRLWSISGSKDNIHLPPDRLIFDTLKRHFRAGESRKATSYYRLNPKNDAHPYRMKWIAEEAQKTAAVRKSEPTEQESR